MDNGVFSGNVAVSLTATLQLIHLYVYRALPRYEKRTDIELFYSAT